jgi:hypothetical protein
MIDSSGQLASRQQPIGLHHLALGMDPAEFYRVEIGALGGQGTGQNPCFLALAVMFPDPLLTVGTGPEYSDGCRRRTGSLPRAYQCYW